MLCFHYLTAHATVSGISDVDYPSLSSSSVGLADLPQLSPAKQVPLPPELVEQFGRILFVPMYGPELLAIQSTLVNTRSAGQVSFLIVFKARNIQLQ